MCFQNTLSSPDSSDSSVYTKQNLPLSRQNENTGDLHNSVPIFSHLNVLLLRRIVIALQTVVHMWNVVIC